MTTAAAPAQRRSLRAVALPAEHGAWGFLLEPLLLALLVAPSWPGLLIAVGTCGTFLARQPLRIVLADRRRGRRFARTALAERFVIGYGLTALLTLGGAALIAGAVPLLPLGIAAPCALVLLIYDARKQSRHWLPELLAPPVLAASAISITLAAGWTAPAALVLWLILTARALPAVLYVRARLRLANGKPVTTAGPILAHVIGLGGVALLAGAGRAPWLAVLALGILLGRTVYGLSPYRRDVPARIIGFQEIGYGLLTVLLTALGYAALA